MKIKKEQRLVEGKEDLVNAVDYVEDNNLENAPEIIDDVASASAEDIKNSMIKNVADAVEDGSIKTVAKEEGIDYEKYKQLYGDDVVFVDDDEFEADADAAYRFAGHFEDISGTGEDGFEQALARAYTQRMESYSRFWRQLKKARDNNNGTEVDRLCSREFKDILSSGGYPNILVWGLPGFGKTATVKEFCAKNHVKQIDMSLSGIAPEVFNGIPYPVISKDGHYIQATVQDPKWTEIIDNPDIPYIIFFDELTRADLETQNLAFNVVNQHMIPCTRKIPAKVNIRTGDYKPGKEVSESLFLNNLLFCVFACNPGSAIFGGTGEVDDALISRISYAYERKANIPAFKKYLHGLYDTIIDTLEKEAEEDGEELSDKIKNKYRGQQRIADCILGDKTFTFDGWDEQAQIHAHNAKFFNKSPQYFNDRATNGQDAAFGTGIDAGDSTVWGNLSYRSFVSLLASCDGTRADFERCISRNGSDGRILRPSAIEMLKKILALNKYKDDFSSSETINSANATPEEKQADSFAAKKLTDAEDLL